MSIVNLIHALFKVSPYASCQPNFLSLLLPLYRGSLSVSDKQILSLFQLFESNRHLSTASLLKCWSPSGVVGAQRAFDTLIALDHGKIFATCIAFPLRRALRGHDNDKSDGHGLYDPAFILPLSLAVLDEKLTGLEWVEFLRSNAIGLSVCSLASRDAPMRALGRKVLGRTMEHILERLHMVARVYSDHDTR